MSGNCKDCRYWESHVDMRGNSWNTCNAADWVSRSHKVDGADFAIYAEAHYDSGLDAGLKTGPMFGCVQFKLKVEQK